MKNFLLNIRRSDHNTKRQWLILFSAITIIIVVSLWVLYARNAVVSFSEQANENPLENELADLDISSSITTDFSNVFSKFKETIGDNVDVIEDNIEE